MTNLATHSPLVSVIVPNYNHAPYLEERLRSIFAQTFTDYEVILLDDASTDGSQEILRQFIAHRNVRESFNLVNSGSPFAQWNRGISMALGEYVWIAESDDTADPSFLAELVPLLETQPTVGVAMSRSHRIDEAGNDCGLILHDAFPDEADRWKQDFMVRGEDEVRQFLFIQNTLPSASAVVFRKSIYLQAGKADESLKLCGDWLQWCKMLRYCDLAHKAEPLAASRIHSRSQRSTFAMDGQYELECLRAQRELLKLVRVDPLTVRRGIQRYAYSWTQSVQAGRYRILTVGHLKMLIRIWRFSPALAIEFLLQLSISVMKSAGKRCLGRNENQQET